MLIHRLKLTNLLSFGPNTEPLELKPLNVLIGPNGSGKSNLIDAFSLLQAIPRDLREPISEGGGIREWLWKEASQYVGTKRLLGGMPTATIEVCLDHSKFGPIRYRLSFTEVGQRLELRDERIERPALRGKKPRLYFGYTDGRALLKSRILRTLTRLRPGEFKPQQSVLAQRKDPELYPEVTYVGEALGRMRLYRLWDFGRPSEARRSQPTDLPNDYLSEDADNLGLILSRLRGEPMVGDELRERLELLYEGIQDFDFLIQGGTIQVLVLEGLRKIPATRLSDGTLRWLCLLTILLHPDPPPLVCIEEPELGLHPDLLPKLADLMIEASSRMQLVVTTHSDVLVDALTHTPEAIVVCEKIDGATRLKRLREPELKVWLKKYSLGQLWSQGQIGGNRW